MLKIIFLVIGSLAFTQCGPLTVVQYVIPNNYQGFLVIEYNCANGISLDPAKTAIVTFSDDGTACVKQKYQDIFPTGVSKVNVKTRSGEQVAFVDRENATNGRGLVDISVMQNRDHLKSQVVERTFSILWTGDFSILEQMYRDETYSTVLAEFLEQHFELPVRPQ